MDNPAPFGGKVVILLGNFWQTCPITPCGTKADILNSCISNCSLWLQFYIAWLIAPIQNAEDLALASFVDEIGDCADPHVNLSFLTCTTDIKYAISLVCCQNTISNPATCLWHCVLVPASTRVNLYNAAVLNLLSSTSHQYHAADSLEEHSKVMEVMNSGLDTGSTLPNPNAILDYVWHQCPNGMPDYNLAVKVGGVCHLLQNFSIDLGLVKNAQVVVVGIGSKLVTVHILQSAQVPGTSPSDILLPHITFKEQLPSVTHFAVDNSNLHLHMPLPSTAVKAWLWIVSELIWRRKHSHMVSYILHCWELDIVQMQLYAYPHWSLWLQ